MKRKKKFALLEPGCRCGFIKLPERSFKSGQAHMTKLSIVLDFQIVAKVCLHHMAHLIGLILTKGDKIILNIVMVVAGAQVEK